METKIKKPLGLRLLRVLYIIAGILIAIELVMSSLIPISSVESNSFSSLNFGYIFYNLIYSILLVVCISRPRSSLFKIAIGFMVVDVVASLIFIFIGYQSISANILSIVINLLILWYFFKLKEYFISSIVDVTHSKTKSIDKKFIILLITIIILYILVNIGLGVLVFKDAFNFASQFQGKTFEQNIEYCKTLKSPSNNMCIATLLGIAVEEKQTIDPKICSYISNSDTQEKNSACYNLIERCDLINDVNAKKSCEDYVRLQNSERTSSTTSNILLKSN